MTNGDDEFSPRARQHLYAQHGIQALEPFVHGQVITAVDLNELIDALKELDRRLSALEVQ